MQPEEKMSVFTCEVCGNYYSYRKSLRRHIYTVHPQQLNDIMPRKDKKRLSYRCSSCDKSFANKYTLSRHQHFIHGQIPQKRLTCMLCAFETTSKKGWLDHLQWVHEIHVKSEDLQFSTEVEFLNWKEDMERRTHSKFITLRGLKVVGDCSRRYYVCHRSGRFISKSKGIRRPRLAGSCKINGKCPAAIKVLCKEGTYRVNFVSTHVGHNLLDRPTVRAKTNSSPPESLHDVGATSKVSESLSGVSASSKTPKSVSDEKQMIISRFSEIVNGLTGREIQIAKRMVISFKEKVCAVREQNSMVNILKNPKRSRKKKIVPKSRISSVKETSCQIPTVVDISRASILPNCQGPESIHMVTVEEDCATPRQQELQSSTTGPFIVNTYHDDMLWKQELEHYELGPISMAMEQDDDISWYQELQHCTPGLETNHYVDVEHNYAAPWHMAKQCRTPIGARDCCH